MATNIEHQAFTALYDVLQTGIQSGIDDIVGKAFSKGLVPPHVKSVSGNSSGPQSEGNRTSILLNAILERIQNLSDTYEEFASVLESITAFKYLADMMRETKSKITKDELERVQRQKEIEQVLRERKQDLHIHLPMENEKHDPHQGNSSVYHPASWSSSVSVQRAADDQFPLLRSFPQGEVGHKSPLGFRGRFSVSSTPGLSPRNSSLISNLPSMEFLCKNSVPQSEALAQQVKSSSKREPLSEPNHGTLPASHKPLLGGTYGHMLIHKTSHSPVGFQQDVGHLRLGLPGPVINPKSGKSEIDSPVSSSEPHQLSPPPSAARQHMPTSSVDPQRVDDSNKDVPSLQTVAPTPMTTLPLSTAFPSVCSNENEPSALVAQRTLSTTSQLSVESSLSSQDFVTAPSSPDVDYEFNPIQESEEYRLQAQVAGSCHQKRQQLTRSSSREQYVDLKRKFEEATKELSRLQIQCYVQQSAHSKKEEELLKELESEKNEKFELQINLEKYEYVHLDLHMSLRQHQKYITNLENKLILLNKRLEDVNSELKDVKVDAYDKGRDLECLKLQIKQYEYELESLRKVHL